MIERRQVLAAGFATAMYTRTPALFAQERGFFSDNPVVRLLPGRLVQLEKELRYRDPRGKLWKVPKRFVSDGASIPRVLWTIAGGPLDGAYRDAAIVHDRYCKTEQRSWQDTHQVFYDGMISRGLSIPEATSKYWAVYHLGPRWDGRHRWTGFLGLNKRLRKIQKSSGPPAAPPLRPSDAEIEANRVREERILNLEMEEYRKAARLIQDLQLGPESVASLRPDPLHAME